MSSPYLRPCPICGSEVHISASSDGYGVECASDGCFALAMDRFLTPEFAAQYWNTRSERYMELPVDADGVPIRTGDIIEFGKKGERLEVTHIGWTKHGEPTIAYRRPNGTLDCSCIGTKCRHVKPRTLEDVLREYALEMNLTYETGEIGGEERAEALDDLTAKYADEIRELMEASE